MCFALLMTQLFPKKNNSSMVASSSRDDGNTRAFLHVQGMVCSRYTVLLLRTVTTDVIAIRLAMFQMFSGL